MNKQILQHSIYNGMQIVYLDSSSLIRNYPLKVLSKNLTRDKYITNPHQFTNKLNFIIKPLLSTSALLHETINNITYRFNTFSVITYDCLFPTSNNQHIHTLFGSFELIDNLVTINNTTLLFGEKISVETFFNASTLIRSANLILIDDYFLSLSIGNQLFNRKKDETTIIPLSTLIGFSSYHTEDVLNIFNYLYSICHIS